MPLNPFSHTQTHSGGLMLAISRMKSLISPTLSKPKSFSFFSNPSQSLFSNFQNPKFSPTFSSLNLTLNFSPVRCLHSNPSQSPSGEIHVIVGPMFAGKTTTLLHRVKSERSNGRNVAIIKSNKDTRYGLDSIVTHDGLKLPCWPLEVLSSFRQRIGAEAYHKLDVIGIDEAQFFGDLYEFCSKVADHDGKTVIVAGLDGDYLRRSFGSVLDVIPIADSVIKLAAHCELCGKPACFTLRKTDETSRELIAGADVYMPVCRQHYVSGQIVKEAARTVVETQKVKCGSL